MCKDHVGVVLEDQWYHLQLDLDWGCWCMSFSFTYNVKMYTLLRQSIKLELQQLNKTDCALAAIRVLCIYSLAKVQLVCYVEP